MLTPAARLAREAYVPLTERTERDWKKRFGDETISQLRIALEEIVPGRDGAPSPLLRGLTLYPDGWRASLPPLEGLPHFQWRRIAEDFPMGVEPTLLSTDRHRI